MTVELKNNAQQFIPGMINHMGEICKDHYERIQNIKKPNLNKSTIISLLAKGIWYSIDYCEALEKFGQNARLDWIVKNGASFHGLMPKTFTSIEDSKLPTGKKIAQYKIAKGVTPSTSLKDLKNSMCLMGCGEVRDIAVYQTLEDLLGREKLDLLFDSDSATPLQIGGGEENPYKRLFKRVEVLNSTYLEPGDFCHFSNIQQYMAKHPFGPARGYNAICKEVTKQEPKFLALGLKSEGCIIAEVEKILLDEFNRSQASERFFNSSILSFVYGKTLLQNEEKSKELVEHHKDIIYTQEQFDKLPNRNAFSREKVERRMLLTVERPDLDKIQKLANASLSEIRKVFDNF